MCTQEKFNWYHGHMAKAMTQLSNNIKNVDLIIEVIDARARFLSSYKELTKFNKPILKIYSKSDLADINKSDDSLFINLKNSNSKKQIISSINKFINVKKQKMNKKMIFNPQFLITVVGMPNVGKSTLINLLKSHKDLAVANMPGLTKKQTIVKISKNVYLQDNPGIVPRTIINESHLYVYGLLNLINVDLLNIDNIINFALKFYNKFYTDKFYNYFKISFTSSLEDFINIIGKKFNILSNGMIDENKTKKFILSIFLSNKICKVDYEKCFNEIY